MINKVIEIAQEAGKTIMELYSSEDLECNMKEDESPVTKADLSSHNTIVNGLKKISSYPILSEEDIIDYKIRKYWDKFWLVDPLDGTKDYIARNGEFTINIALIENNKPILGVVYLPFYGDTYYAQLDEGAFKNGKRIYNNSKRKNLIGADSIFHSTPEMQSFFKRYEINDIRRIGSSIKICKMAEGVIDVYPRLNGTKEWDTAATHIIANEAGCKLVDIKTKEEIVYNKMDYRNNFFIASRKDLEFNV